MLSKAQWESARLRYQTDCCVMQEVLAEELGCTCQAVSKTAIIDHCTKVSRQALEVAHGLDCSKPISGSKLGKRLPENITEIVNAFAITGNKKLA